MSVQIDAARHDQLQSRQKYEQFRRDFDGLVAAEKAKWDAERATLRETQAAADDRLRIVDRLGTRFLKDTVRSVSQKLRPENFALQKGRLEKVIAFCRKQEYDVPEDVERELFADLRVEYEAVLRKDAAKREQARIKAQIREERRAVEAFEKQRRQAEAEEKAVQDALAEARRQAATLHGAELAAREAEIAELAELLAEAESRTARTRSMAELTKAGHVYVISNRGCFGPDVYKVGMTRRQDPNDRVKELGDASVPFPFDVHMMISCDDAPSLENALHKALHDRRVNKVNLRKEFFRTDLDAIVGVVEANHGSVDYVAEMEALEYHQSAEMADEDFLFLSAREEEFEKNHPEFAFEED